MCISSRLAGKFAVQDAFTVGVLAINDFVAIFAMKNFSRAVLSAMLRIYSEFKKNRFVMKIECLLFTALIFSACTSMSSTTLPVEGEIVKANDSHIQYIGRVILDPSGVLRFNYPGTEIRARFQGTSLKMLCRPKTGYFTAIIDGCQPFKVGFNAPKDSLVTLAVALKKGAHDVRIVYDIEGLNRPCEFHGFVLDKGCRLLDAPPLPERKIEFIGNSITCGFGNESLNGSDPFEDESENHFLTYAQKVSDALGAQHVCVARSGIGVYRNAGGPKEGTPNSTMQVEYPYTLFGKHDVKWDFSKFRPQLVFINLGTNDFSGDNYDAALYESNYRKFLATVRSIYRDAKIVLATGSMLNGEKNALQQKVLNRICEDVNASGDKNVYRFDFTPQSGDLGYGAGMHPSAAQHEKMAKELLPFLKKLMGWK